MTFADAKRGLLGACLNLANQGAGEGDVLFDVRDSLVCRAVIAACHVPDAGRAKMLAMFSWTAHDDVLFGVPCDLFGV